MNLKIVKTPFVILLLTNCAFTHAAEEATQANTAPITVQQLDLENATVVAEWKDFCTKPETQTLGRTPDSSEKLFTQLMQLRDRPLERGTAQMYGAKQIGTNFTATAVGLLGMSLDNYLLQSESKDRKSVARTGAATMELLGIKTPSNDTQEIAQDLLTAFACNPANKPIVDVYVAGPLFEWDRDERKRVPTDPATITVLENIGFRKIAAESSKAMMYRHARVLIPKETRTLQAQLQTAQKQFDSALMELVNPEIHIHSSKDAWNTVPYRDDAYITAKALAYGKEFPDSELDRAREKWENEKKENTNY